MNTETAEMSIVRRGDEFFVITKVLGETRELGPYRSGSDAHLYYGYLMNVAKRAGATEVPAAALSYEYWRKSASR